MKVVILDMTHGGDLIAKRYLAEGYDVTCVDVYRNCPSERREELVSMDVRFCEETPKERYDLAVLPIHCPMWFLGESEVERTITFSQAVHEFIQDTRFRIEVTGVKGKTSTCYILAKILHDSGRRVLLHTSRGEGEWTDEGHRIDRFVSIAPPYLMTLPVGDYDVIISEISLGGSGRADISLITNLVEDYGVAKGSLKASDGKKDIFSDDGVNIVSEDELDFWRGMCPDAMGYGVRVRELSEPRLGQPLKVSVDYDGVSEIELDGSYISMEYLRAMDAALGVCNVIGVPKDVVLCSLETFKGVPGRGEIIRDGDRIIVRERNPGISPLSVRRTMECLAEMDCLRDALVILDPVSRKVCDKMRGNEIRDIVESYGVPIVITEGDGVRPEIPADVGLLVEFVKEGYQ